MYERPLIFIHHAEENKSHAKQLRDDLNRAGERVWLDKEDILPGQDWKNAIKQAIQKSRYVITLLSKLSLEKVGFLQHELKLVRERQMEYPDSKIYIIPARLEDCDLASSPLSSLQYVDLFPSWTDGVNRILSAIAFEHGYAIAKGGIDFHPEHLNIENENFAPVILNIIPINNLPPMLHRED